MAKEIQFITEDHPLHIMSTQRFCDHDLFGIPQPFYQLLISTVLSTLPELDEYKYSDMSGDRPDRYIRRKNDEFTFQVWREFEGICSKKHPKIEDFDGLFLSIEDKMIETQCYDSLKHAVLAKFKADERFFLKDNRTNEALRNFVSKHSDTTFLYPSKNGFIGTGSLSSDPNDPEHELGDNLYGQIVTSLVRALDHDYGAEPLDGKQKPSKHDNDMPSP